MQLAAAAGRPDAFLAGSMVLKPAAKEDARLQRRQQKETHRREQERKARPTARSRTRTWRLKAAPAPSAGAPPPLFGGTIYNIDRV